MSDPEKPSRVQDVGLQQERTALAWDRTGLALVVAGALFVRAAPPPIAHFRNLPGLWAIIVGALLIARSWNRYSDMRRTGGAAAAPASWTLVRLVAATVALLSAGALILIAVRTVEVIATLPGS